jgi:hypothetical protein
MQIETQPAGPRDHVVQFYERDEELVLTVSGYLGDGLRAGEVAIVVATEVHWLAFEAALRRSGIDVTQAVADGTLLMLDACQTLPLFMTDTGPDPAAFDDVIGDLVRRATRSGRRLRAYGEMVALLWDAGDVTAAIELEALWNNLGLQVPFSLFCAYPMQSVGGSQYAHAFDQVCHLHSAIIEAPTSPSGPPARCFAKGHDAPRAARCFVIETLRQWGRDELVDDAAVIVSELATNAVVHAQSDFTVTMSSPAGGVRITVRDASVAPPILGDLVTTTNTSGRGVALVATLSDEWGSDLLGDGKIVWVELGGKSLNP